MLLKWLMRPYVFAGFMMLGSVTAGLLAVPFLLGMYRFGDTATISFTDLNNALMVVLGCALGGWLFGVWWIRRQRCACGAMSVHVCGSNVTTPESHT